MAIEYLSPGVYGEETDPTRAAEGISPAKMGIIGWTERGPVNTPIEVRSVNEFTRYFGDINARGLVAISMRPFFGTGGQRAWVVRIVPSDALEASTVIDTSKWTFTANGAGEWGNNLIIQIEGNRNFLDRTAGAQKWTKFDLKVLQPSNFDPTIYTAAETFEAIQFTDALASDYVVAAMTDPRGPSLLVDILAGSGGDPSAFDAAQILDEVIGVGDALGTKRYAGTLAQYPVLDNTIRIVCSELQVDDQDQTVVPDFNPALAPTYTWTMPTAPILDGSARYFYAKSPFVSNALTAATPPLVGGEPVVNIVPGTLSAPVHKDATNFRIKYVDTGTAPSGPTTLYTLTAAPEPVDLGAGGLAGPILPIVPTPIHPGTLAITVSVVLPGDTIITDNGQGIIPAQPGMLTPGTIDYDTGLMTGLTVPLLGLSTVDATHFQSSVVTMPAQGDNLAQGLVLGGAVGVGPDTIDLVDSVSAPTGNGLITFTPLTSINALAPTLYLDYAQLGIVTTDVAGIMSGDIVSGEVDFSTGEVLDFTLSAVYLPGTTIDADYQTGQVVTDDGLGNLVGDVDATGENIIDYDTGVYDVTFDSAPLNGSNVLANYTKLAKVFQWPLSGGTNGTAVSRADISDPSLESAREGIYAFDDVEDPLNIVVPDFEGSTYVQADVVDYCEARNTRFAILGFANGTTKDEAIKYVLVDQSFDTKVAAIYWPNVYYVNELTDRVELMPVTPFIAGVYAKTAFNKNVGKSPGGIDDGALDANGTIGPEFGDLVNDIRIRDDLYQSRINPLFNSDATGFVVWGVRSLSTEFRWRYVNARTLHNFLMDAIQRQLNWAVFENNGPALWLKVETAIKGFMGSLFRQGYFAGVTEQQAFFVVCNASNNDQSTVDQGRVICDVGFSPFKPAEFVIFRLSQPASTITV